MEDSQIRSKIHPNQHVFVAVKINGQYSPDLHEGIVEEILTKSSEHYRGIKVKLQDGTVGRVKIISKKQKK